MPLGSRECDGQQVSFIELIFTRLYACREAKPSEMHKNWCHSGIAALCALTDSLVVTVHRDGGEWEQRFARGHATSQLARIGDASDTSTRLRFTIDRTILKGAFNVAQIAADLRDFSRDVPCVPVALRNLRTTSSRE